MPPPNFSWWDRTWARGTSKPSLSKTTTLFFLKLQVCNLLGLSSPRFGWWSGPPPPMTHRSPHGSFCSGWACSRRAGSLPAAACHTCPGYPGTACVLPSWSCPCSHPEIGYRVSALHLKLILYKPLIIRSQLGREIFLCKNTYKRGISIILLVYLELRAEAWKWQLNEDSFFSVLDVFHAFADLRIHFCKSTYTHTSIPVEQWQAKEKFGSNFKGFFHDV